MRSVRGGRRQYKERQVKQGLAQRVAHGRCFMNEDQESGEKQLGLLCKEHTVDLARC